jgi:TRAP-type C4-dicarboxylate transport system permease small subunit
MMILTKLNNFLAKASYLVGIIIVAIMVMALSLSAITRYVSGTGYDWLIELPPVLICWLVFPLLGPLLREGNHIQVDFLTSIISTKRAKYLKIVMNLTAFIASLIFFKAGMEATMLYFNLGQMMELEIGHTDMVDVFIISSWIYNSSSIFTRTDNPILFRLKSQ